MSAYIVDDTHLDLLLSAGLLWMEQTYDRPALLDLGKKLRLVNQDSVNARYGEFDPAPPYTFRALRWYRMSAVQVLKAINGYEYQADEHPAWVERSGAAGEVRTFLDRLQAIAIRRLPGYEDALWHVGDEDRPRFTAEVGA